MNPTITFNGTEDIDVSRVTITGRLRLDGRRSASASGLMPTIIEIQREVNLSPSDDFFNAGVASPDSANEVTLECEMEVHDGTAYTVTVEEGTVTGWRLSQEDPDDPVLETTTVMARKAELEGGGGTVDLTLAAFK